MEGSGSPPSEGERRKGAAGRAQEAGARASLRRRYPGPPWPSGRPQPGAGVGARGFVCGVPRALGRRGRGGRGTDWGLARPARTYWLIRRPRAPQPLRRRGVAPLQAAALSAKVRSPRYPRPCRRTICRQHANCFNLVSDPPRGSRAPRVPWTSSKTN